MSKSHGSRESTNGAWTLSEQTRMHVPPLLWPLFFALVLAMLALDEQ